MRKKIVRFLLLLQLLLSATYNCRAQDSWTAKADFPGNGRAGCTGFSIGKYGYIGGGTGVSNGFDTSYNDFWRYDPDSNVWRQLPSIGKNLRSPGPSFTIGGKGYFIDGDIMIEYDPQTNKWMNIGEAPIITASYSVAFTIGQEVYIGFSVYNEGVDNHFWKYTPAGKKWTRIADFPGKSRIEAAAFSIGNKGYIGTGEDSEGVFYNDFWEYDPNTNQWNPKESLPASARRAGIGFGIAGYGYIGLGRNNGNKNFDDLWQYDTLKNLWTQMSSCDSSFTSYGSFVFVIGNKAFVAGGIGRNSNYGNGLLEYADHNASIDYNTPEIQFSIFPNPCNGHFTIRSGQSIQQYQVSDMNGKLLFAYPCQNQDHTIEADLALTNGLYLVKAISKNGSSVEKLIVANH